MRIRWVVAALMTELLSDATFLSGATLQPPVAAVRPHPTEIHGVTLPDNYYWLRDKKNPEVIQHLEAENRYTEAVMQPVAGLEKQIYSEIIGRIQQTDMNVPAQRGNFLYYTRTVEGQQYPIVCRKPLDSNVEQVLLEQNEMAKGHSYLRIGSYRPSPNGHLLAYSVDVSGDENYTIRVKDLESGTVFDDQVGNTDGSVAWANDNQTLFYVTVDASKRPYKIWRHKLGTAGPDANIYEETDNRFEVGINTSRSGRYIFTTSESRTTSEVRFIDTDHPEAAPRLVTPRDQEVEYEVRDQGDQFYVLTNDHAKNFRLMTVPISDPAKSNWKEVMPHQPSVMLENIDVFKGFLVVYERENGLQKVRVQDTSTHQTHFIEFPEPVYSVMALDNYVYDTAKLRFRYTSLVTPDTVFDYDMAHKTREMRKQQQVLGGYDPSQYVSERIFAPAGDGKRIPIALVYKKGTARNGQTPLYLDAYGSYGLNNDPVFAPARLSLLTRGFTVAIASIRGGGELGKEWHDGGKMLTKRNTFTDFIAAAEYLIAKKYTSPQHLVIQGASAGGMLMGAVVNMRPDLFRAVVAKVPFVDVVNTMLDETIPLTTNEFEEWGNPKDKKYFDYMISYSPYDNIAHQAYPNILITAGLNDPRVGYWEPAKFTAKLRAMKTDHNLLLLKTEMGSGHFGSSGRYEHIKQTAFEYAFVLLALGMAH